MFRTLYWLIFFFVTATLFAAARPGYVYVISNYGSFGRAVYKIGATTRKDPYVRVRELSGTAVPYPFRVHYMIPAADTYGLERQLHAALAPYRIRKNREFFRVPLAKINAVLKAHDIPLKSIRLPDAAANDDDTPTAAHRPAAARR